MVKVDLKNFNKIYINKLKIIIKKMKKKTLMIYFKQFKWIFCIIQNLSLA